MTIETPSAEPATKGFLNKGRRFFITLAVIVGVAAVATEALFWSVAAALGLSVLEARKRIWRKITGRGRAET